MESKMRMPLYKWLIISASIVLILILTVFVVFIISNFAENGIGPSLAAMWQDPSESDEPTKKLRDPNAEVRGVWIATVENIDFPSKQGLDVDSLKAELEDIVNTVNKAGLNTIYFQVRPSSDALYNSKYFPTSKYLTGQQGTDSPDGFDALAYLIQIAHKEDIYVHAWVNPLRVTTGTTENPQHDLNALSANNPARQNPDWVIPYDDGKLYYDAGIPEVRDLVAKGVAEIVENYDIDGIVFDDYFYPYPVTGGVFEDESTYEKYGSDYSDKADWRRDNVNKMIEQCYDVIKATNPECLFGVAPCGIWQNDNGSNGGSDTKGFSAYSEIYCDALAWAAGGYVDYIAPQIYWSFSNTNARFDVLVKWWNQQLDAYDDVDLIICHAMYRSAEWGITDEIKNQIEYARSAKKYTGSILYGYAALKRNDMDLMTQLQEVYEYEYVYNGIESNDAEFTVGSPANSSYINLEATYVIGMSDPAYPLYIDGVAVPRTKSGYFSMYLSLEKGENKFTFTHKDETYEYLINRGVNTNTDPTTYQEMDSFKIISISPTNDYIVSAGTVIEVTVVAPSNSTVTAKLRNAEIILKPTISPPDNAVYMRETYTGTFTVPDWAGEGEIANLGNIEFTVVRGDESVSATGANVRIMGKNAYISVEVVKDDTELKVSETSWYYDDYTTQSTGMRDQAISLKNGYYQLRMGGYLDASGVKEIEQKSIPIAKVNNAYMTTNEKETVFYIETGENVPINGYIEDGEFVFTLYNVDPSTAKDIELINNPMITAVRYETYSKENAYKYFCTLVDLDNFYGYEFGYIDGTATISLRNPQTIKNNSQPLEGKVIIIDAGHGGSDTGATGPDNTYNEADMNLDIAMEAVKALEKLGATVVTTRTENVNVDIYKRLDLIIDTKPDLIISIHQNSMNYDSDITKIRGLLGLYFADSGRLLTKTMSSVLSSELNRYERTPTQQRLAMVRNPKYPSTLIEVGFITCVEEYDLMRRDGTIERTGKAIANGVVEYYKAQAKYLT